MREDVSLLRGGPDPTSGAGGMLRARPMIGERAQASQPPDPPTWQAIPPYRRSRRVTPRQKGGTCDAVGDRDARTPPRLLLRLEVVRVRLDDLVLGRDLVAGVTTR